MSATTEVKRKAGFWPLLKDVTEYFFIKDIYIHDIHKLEENKMKMRWRKRIKRRRKMRWHKKEIFVN